MRIIPTRPMPLTTNTPAGESVDDDGVVNSLLTISVG